MLSQTVAWNGGAFPASVPTIQSYLGATDVVPVIGWRYMLVNSRTLAPIPTGMFGPDGSAGDCTDWINAVTFHQDSTQDVAGSAKMTLRDAAQLGFNAATHAIWAFCQYWAPGGHVLMFEVPVGIFWCAQPHRTIDGGHTFDQLDMVDLAGKISRIAFLNNYAAVKGVAFTTLMRSLLAVDYLPLSQGGTGQTPGGQDLPGPAWPSARINLDPSTATLPGDQTFNDTQNFIVALNSLAQTINYRNWRVDALGTLQCHAKTDISAMGAPPVVRAFTTGLAGVLQAGLKDDLTNMAALANIVKVKSQNANAAVIASTQFNTQADSAISLPVLQEAIPKIITDNAIPTQAIADSRANLELALAASLSEQATIVIPPDPFLELHDSIGLTVIGADGSTLISSPLGWELVGYDIDTQALTMTLTLNRYVRI